MKVVPMTLKRRTDRQERFLGAAALIGVPPEQIHFFEAMDGQAYENDLAQVVLAASDDGFPYLRNFGKGLKTQFSQQTAGSMAQVWSYCRLFRWLADSQETVVILHDDRLFTFLFDFFQEIVDKLLKASPNFHLFQLRIRGHEKEAVLPTAWSAEELLQHDHAIFRLVTQNQLILMNWPLLLTQPGLCGYDESFVISPAGARWLLAQLARFAEEEFMFFDYFLCHRAAVVAEEVLAAQGQIYCPRLRGYHFVNEWLPAGTDTHYAPVGSLDYEKSLSQTELQWVSL